MKRYFNLFLLATLLVGGCNPETIGYLYTEEAVYPVNRLEIYDIPARIAELKGVLAEFEEKAGPLQKEYDRLNTEFLKKDQEVKDFVGKVVMAVEDTVNNILKPGQDDAKIAELKDKLEKELYPRQEQLEKERDQAQTEVQRVKAELDKLADELQITSPLLVQKEIDELEGRIKFKSPWVTSPMQGIQGTEPLIYEIAGVWNENPQNALEFAKYLTAEGGGKLCVGQEVNVPDGEYRVSVKVSNEGHSEIFTDAFTFVVNLEGNNN